MGKLLFPIKNNITRVTFNYVRDNPGSTRKEIITALDHQGFGQGSTSSLLSQLAKNNLIHATNGLFYADVQEYTPVKKVKPLKSNGLKPAREIIKPKDVKKESAGIAALHPDTAELPHPKRFVSLVRNRQPQDVLKDMTVYQAHELYVHLKQMFGG